MAYIWKNHPRNITDYQPQDGCVVDAMSLDDAMKDVVEWSNNIPPGSIANRWLSHTASAGWSPASQYKTWEAGPVGTTDTPRQYPFMRQLNAVGADSVLGADPSRFSNRQRVKGCKVPGLRPNSPPSKSYQLVWTIPLRFPVASILRSVDLTMVVDDWHTRTPTTGSGYNNTYLYDASGGRGIPQGYNDKDPMENMSIVVHVDHPLASENRNLNDVEVAIHNLSTAAGDGTATYPARRRSVSAIKIPAAATITDMAPARLGGSLEGIHISEEVNIPIRPDARVRIAIVIPVDTASSDPNSGWNTEVPQLTQQWNLSYTWMEALS